MIMRPLAPSLLTALWLLVAPCIATAQTPSAIPLRTGPLPALPQSSAPLPWSQLSALQQRMLAPVRAQWPGLSPQRQQRLAAHATHWASLPPAHRRQIQRRLTQWASMTPSQRHQLRANARAFRDLPPAERAKVNAAFRRFQALSPTERHALRERWRSMSPQQRARWSTTHPIPLQPPASSSR